MLHSSPEPAVAGSERGNPVRGSVLLCWDPGVPRVARGTIYSPLVPTGRSVSGEGGAEEADEGGGGDDGEDGEFGFFEGEEGGNGEGGGGPVWVVVWEDGGGGEGEGEVEDDADDGGGDGVEGGGEPGVVVEGFDVWGAEM